MTTVWVMLSVGDERQHGGNDGYDDSPQEHYSWDDTVPNHAKVAVGDVIALWNKKELVGFSVIEAIDTATAQKAVYSCPECGKADFKFRKTRTPPWRCNQCEACFDRPVEKIKTVTTYRSRHGQNWRDSRGLLTGAQVRALCDSPKSQLSMRPARWERLREALAASKNPDIAAAMVISGESQRRKTRRGRLAGGHRIGKTRTRVGQQAFRERLLDEQGENCAFTGPAPACVLDAAHLYSYADSGEHHEFGGLLLRRDIHRLFDLGHITVDPDTGQLDVIGLDDYPLYAGLHGAPVLADLHDEHRVWLDAHWAEHRGQA